MSLHARLFRRHRLGRRGRPKVGVALGGGFARGLAHIGILKVLEEENIPVDFIAGTSVGAVIGAAYASGISAKELEEIASLVRFKDFSRWTFSRFGLFSNDKMSIFLRKILRCKTFEELHIPLAIAATDIITGEPAVFTKGDLVDPVRASCAYPGMFQPVKIGGPAAGGRPACAFGPVHATARSGRRTRDLGLSGRALGQAGRPAPRV